MGRELRNWVSVELEMAMVLLSAQQANGLVRIAEADILGNPISSLLDCPGQICTSTTYYGSGKRKGWRGKLEFRTALMLAQRDARAWKMKHGPGDAMVTMSSGAPPAAQALVQQVTSDDGAIAVLARELKSANAEDRKDAARGLGATGQRRVIPILDGALRSEQDPDVRKMLIGAVAEIAGYKNSEQRSAAVEILNRVNVKTAPKQSITVVGEIDDDELEELWQQQVEQAAAIRAQEMEPVSL